MEGEALRLSPGRCRFAEPSGRTDSNRGPLLVPRREIERRPWVAEAISRYYRATMSDVDWQPIKAVDAREASAGSRGVAAKLELSPPPDDQWERMFNNASLPWPEAWPRPKAAGRELHCAGVPEDDLDRFVAAVKDLIVAANSSYRNVLDERGRQDAAKLAQEDRDDALLRRIQEILRAD